MIHHQVGAKWPKHDLVSSFTMCQCTLFIVRLYIVIALRAIICFASENGLGESTHVRANLPAQLLDLSQCRKPCRQDSWPTNHDCHLEVHQVRIQLAAP